MARITIFAGHYGSGKTNVALNYARMLKRRQTTNHQPTTNNHQPTTNNQIFLADLDIVNPYFRTKDSAEELAREGIGLVVSEYANSNVDFPAMPKEIYALVADRSDTVVMDVGGDDRGALALGRYVPDIREEGDYEMLAVVNASRPLTRTPMDAIGVMAEIEAACGLAFTGIVNNTNLGLETRAEDVIGSVAYAEEISQRSGLPVRFTSVAERLAGELDGKVENILPLKIQKLYYQLG